MSQTKEPLVTVLIPVFNAEKYLHDALVSILSQTYKNLEVLVIDDGSTDNSLKIMTDLSKKDSRVMVTSRENKGIIRTLNEGLDMSRGEYVARIDADDIAYPNRIDRQVRVFQKNGSLCMCASDYDSIVVGNRIFPHPAPTITSENIDVVHLFCTGVVHSTVMFRMSILNQFDIRYNEIYKYAEDFDLFRRLSKNYKCHFIHEKLLGWRINHQSVSRRHTTEMLKTHFLIVEEQMISIGISIDIGIFSIFCDASSLIGKYDVTKACVAVREIWDRRHNYIDGRRKTFEDSFDIFLMLLYRVMINRAGVNDVYSEMAKHSLVIRLKKKDKIVRLLDKVFPLKFSNLIADAIGIEKQIIRAVLFGRDVSLISGEKIRR